MVALSPLNVAGMVSYRHKFVDMTRVIVEESNFTRAGKTCPAAMGFSFAAGTTDGESEVVDDIVSDRILGIIDFAFPAHLLLSKTVIVSHRIARLWSCGLAWDQYKIRV